MRIGGFLQGVIGLGLAMVLRLESAPQLQADELQGQEAVGLSAEQEPLEEEVSSSQEDQEDQEPRPKDAQEEEEDDDQGEALYRLPLFLWLLSIHGFALAGVFQRIWLLVSQACLYSLLLWAGLDHGAWGSGSGLFLIGLMGLGQAIVTTYLSLVCLLYFTYEQPGKYPKAERLGYYLLAPCCLGLLLYEPLAFYQALVVNMLVLVLYHLYQAYQEEEKSSYGSACLRGALAGGTLCLLTYALGKQLPAWVDKRLVRWGYPSEDQAVGKLLMSMTERLMTLQDPLGWMSFLLFVLEFGFPDFFKQAWELPIQRLLNSKLPGYQDRDQGVQQWAYTMLHAFLFFLLALGLPERPKA